MTEYKDLIKTLITAFNGGHLEVVQENFSQEIKLSRHSSSQLKGSVVHLRKALDQWIKRYPLTQLEYVNSMVVGTRVLLYLRVLRHPEEAAFDAVFMLEISEGKVVGIDLLLSEFKASSRAL